MIDDWDKELCIICRRILFNYPSTWDPVCLDCWVGHVKEKKVID